MRIRFVYLLHILSLLTVFPLFSDSREVLLLNSYHQRMTWVQDLVRGVEEILNPEEKNISLRIENMDTKVFFSEEYLITYRDYLRVKYKETNFSLILCSDNNAFNFLRNYRDFLFPGVPLVFCGVNDFQIEQISNMKDITGVAEKFSAKETVDLILDLHKETREIFVINDYLTTGRAWARDIDMDLQSLPVNIEINHSPNVPIAELKREIANLKEGTVILLGVYFADSENYSSTYEQIGAMLAESSNVPVYCLLGFNLGKGIVGGNVISGFDQGKSMAEMGRDILNGRDIGSIPVLLSGNNKYIFDYVQLERFGIDRRELPENSQIINRPYTLLNRYKRELIIALISFSALFIVIIFLIINNKKLSDVEKALLASKRDIEDSESKLKSILDHAPALISIKNINGDILMVNQEFSNLDGPSPEEYPGKNIFDIFPKDVAENLWQNDIKAYETEEPIEVEEIIKAKDGTSLTYLTVKFPVYISSDKPFGICSISTNITKRKIVERELNQLGRYLENIIDSMPSALIGVDADLKVSLWNKNAENITGLVIDNAKGHMLDEVYPMMKPDMDKVSNSILSQEIVKERKKVIQPNKELHHIDITIFPLSVEDQRGAVIRIDDVTDQVKLEEVILQNEKMLSVGGLAAGMAHEINNPLAGILQSASVLTSRLRDKINMSANLKAAHNAGVSIESIGLFLEERGVLKLIDSIDESGKRAAGIVNNILSFSRDESARTSSCNLEQLFEKTLDLASTDYNLQKKYDFKHIKIVREFEDNPPDIICEATKIQQVFLNLLLNGAEAMRDSRTENPRFHIRIFSEKKLKRLCFELEDNGPGMDEEIRKRIFEPFYTTKPIGLGTGLGLSVSYFIITKNHNGEISVESSPGSGAKFIIKLPL